MVVQIWINVPGLQNAGVMWAGDFTGSLLALSFIDSITDRRLFFLADEGGLLLIAGTFVDDFKGVVHSETKAIEFNKTWEERYREPPDIDAATREILGLKKGAVQHSRPGPA